MSDQNQPNETMTPDAEGTQPEAGTDQQERSTIITRRELIGLLIGTGASFVAAATLASPLENLIGPTTGEGEGGGHYTVGSSPHHWVMVIDLNKCVGCDYCVYACQATNDTTDDQRWNIRVTDRTQTGNVFHVTRPCLHCNEAPCVSVCPVAATYNRADGLVMMDYDRCIGCRYCQTACPYGARVFNFVERDDDNPRVPEFGRPEIERRDRGVVEKCTFCVHRIDAGLANGLMPGVDEAATPACVNICPVTARWFGDLNDPNSEVSRIIDQNPTLRLREDLGTDPNVYYIPPEGMVI